MYPDTDASIIHVPTSPDTLTIVAQFPHSTPARLFECWIDPNLIAQWWPDNADIDARVDGAYHLSWPSMNWRLRGRYTTFLPAEALAFTWSWDHEADIPEQTVTVLFQTQPAGGCAIALTHGPYDRSQESQRNRQGHLEGWKHFLGRLQVFEAEKTPQ